MSAITLGPDGNLWFTASNSNRIGYITASGTITQFAIPTANSAPTSIVARPDGNLWFTGGIQREQNRTDHHGGGHYRVLVGSRKPARPAGITAGVDGKLWFAEQNNNAIGRITTSGTVTEFAYSHAQQCGSMDHGGAGRRHLVHRNERQQDRAYQLSTGVITEFPVPTANAALEQIRTSARTETCGS